MFEGREHNKLSQRMTLFLWALHFTPCVCVCHSLLPGQICNKLAAGRSILPQDTNTHNLQQVHTCTRLISKSVQKTTHLWEQIYLISPFILKLGWCVKTTYNHKAAICKSQTNILFTTEHMKELLPFHEKYGITKYVSKHWAVGIKGIIYFSKLVALEGKTGGIFSN